MNIVKYISGDFPGSPEAKTPCSQYKRLGLIPDQGSRSLMPKLRVFMQQLKILLAAKRPSRAKTNYFKKETSEKQVKCVHDHCYYKISIINT